jgi:CHAD domain-containing protein
MLDALDGDKIRDALRTLHGFAAEQPDEQSDEETILVRHFVGGAVWRRYEDVLRHECLLPTESAPVLHEIRIACKRQRYALEMFTHAFGSKVDPLIALLVTIQDCLGTHQDCVVARGYLQRSQAEAPDQRALAIYDEALASEQIALRAQFLRLWAQVSGKAFRRDLAALIAAL